MIYDLSSLTFEMSIDELDIKEVEVGQKVAVTADAYEGQTFSGTVTNVKPGEYLFKRSQHLSGNGNHG